MTTAIAVVGAVVVLLGAAARIPGAIAEVVRACIELVCAFQQLHEVWRRGQGSEGPSAADMPEAAQLADGKVAITTMAGQADSSEHHLVESTEPSTGVDTDPGPEIDMPERSMNMA
ncbi:hypothetical protein ACFY1J_15335 [Streptomyces sp. NPDC001406]|uniref:hypothetical protein n=1 Tax=Streptomyces sp. NPDC001406 TaxID=3364572 RepID=UPI0036927AF0